jgi:tRNA modification GTPase
VLYFPAPNTVTGEEVLELHVHGGPAIVRAVLSAIPKTAKPEVTHSIRYSEPGEFTRRAFANNRMDLPQIESLGETLSASTEQQRRLSVRGTTSSLATRYEAWRTLLLQARGELEALIDFSEDQHFDESPSELCVSVASQVRKLTTQIEAHVTNANRGELLRSGISVALLGAPNAGKSSLLNCIVGREAAIVSQEAGTTRDIVEVGVDLGGWLVKIGDMAGLRRAGLVGPGMVGAIEQEGIKRAKKRALESDVLIVVQDATTEMDPEVTETAKQCVDLGINVVVAINKIDRLENPGAFTDWKEKIQSVLRLPTSRIFFVSCMEAIDINATDTQSKVSRGIQAFLRGLMDTFKDMTSALVPDSEPDPSIWQESLGATERQRLLLSECLSHLDAFVNAVHNATDTCLMAEFGTTPYPPFDRALIGTGDDVDIVVAAESLRLAADSLARITGRGEGGDVEEVLGVVFEKYVTFHYPQPLPIPIRLLVSDPHLLYWVSHIFLLHRAQRDCAATRRIRSRVAIADIPTQHMIQTPLWGWLIHCGTVSRDLEGSDYPARDRFLLRRRPPRAHLPRMLVESAVQCHASPVRYVSEREFALTMLFTF